MNTVVRFAELVVGILLVYSGLNHSVNPYFFAVKAADYEFVPLSLLWVIPFVLSPTMISLGICLIAFSEMLVPKLISAGVLGVFAVAQSTVWVRGIDISCGCFGYSNESISLYSISIPFLCGIVCVLGARNVTLDNAASD